MIDYRTLAVTGVVPPERGEVRIRESWPSVAGSPAIAGVGKALTRTIILAPLAWMIMALVYFKKLLPIFARRYTLTNRRLMIRKGWKGTPSQEVALADIEDVRVVTDVNSDFFRAGTLEVVGQGGQVMRMPGMPEPESFRVAVLNACTAMVPGKSKMLPFLAASASPDGKQ